MTRTPKNEYQPDHVSLPGETLAETLDYMGMSQSELARRIGRPIKTINEIINGKTSITPETALQLERAIGVAARFWLNRENDYRTFLTREDENTKLKSLAHWTRQFPVPQMVRYGWLPASDTIENTARSLLSFFGVASDDQYEKIYATIQAAFRKSRKVKSNPDAIAAWYRKAVLESQCVDCRPYAEPALRVSLCEARKLTAERPEVFVPRLRQVCADVGVAVVFVHELRGAPVNGAAAWLSPKKAMIALSLRYKTNDVLWFSFFHEAAHLLKHSRRAIFVDVGNGGSTDDDIEQEANRFASEFLIPPDKLKTFLATPQVSSATVIKFAASIGVAPGIVVGRLQHDSHLPHTHLNSLKLRLEWSDDENVAG